ncbi:MAG: alpha/beta fold hydrolase [Sneathiella sp.]
MPLSTSSGMADLGTHQLFYKIRGQGPRLLQISGTNSDTRHKPSVYDIPGADSYEILSFDNRGMGQSTSPDEPPSMEAYAEDVAKLLAIVGWKKTAIVGFSFGGMIAQHLALHHPHLVERLVLCCTSSGGRGGASYPLQKLQDLPARDFAASMMKLMNVSHTDAWQTENPIEAKRVFDMYWQSADATLNDPVKYAAMKAQFAARAHHDTYDALSSLSMPVLVACGEDDGVALPENSKRMADAIPGAEFHVFEGGHMFFKENPAAWPFIFRFVTGA